MKVFDISICYLGKRLLRYNQEEAVMKRPLSEDFIKQNLEDAGCDCDLIECILADYEASDKEEMRKRLNKHRKELLDLVHENYKKIDCLDYLCYQIEKEKGDKNVK